jgi:hypothetical protein
MSCLISQPLANRTFERDLRALNVINAKPDAIIHAEIKFGQIPMKMSLINVLVDADQATLEDRKEPLKGIGVNVAARPFKLGMIDAFMASNWRVSIVRSLIGNEAALPIDMGMKVRPDAPMIEGHGPDVSTTLDKAKNRRFRFLALWAALGLMRIG